MSDKHDSQAVRINSVALIIVTTLALLVAVTPVLINIHRPQLLILFAVLAMPVLWLSGRSFKTVATEAPGFWDFAFGGFGAMFLPSFIAIIWMLLYWAIFLLVGLVEWLVNEWGGDIHPEADLFAFWLTIILAIPFLLLVAKEAQDSLSVQLYPNIVGVKSGFYDLMHFGRRGLIRNSILILVVVLVLVTILYLLGHDLSVWWFNLGLLGLIFFASSPLSGMGMERQAPPGGEEAVEAVMKLLKAGGYEVHLSPRTGREDVDPLLAEIDLLIQNDECAILGVVIMSQPDVDPPEWKFVRDLLPAAWAMERVYNEDSADEEYPVDLLMVMIGGKVDIRMRDYAADNNVYLSDSLDANAIAEVLQQSDDAELAALCRRHFEFSRNGATHLIMEDSPDSGGTA